MPEAAAAEGVVSGISGYGNSVGVPNTAEKLFLTKPISVILAMFFALAFFRTGLCRASIWSREFSGSAWRHNGSGWHRRSKCPRLCRFPADEEDAEKRPSVHR